MKYFSFAILLLAGTAFAQEDRLLAIFRADATPLEKSDACRELARVGTRQAVPVLAPLLADEQLSHMARFALEPIADPAVDEALRDALGKVKGQLLVGVISSLGVRKDPAAIVPLGKFLTNSNPAVAQAAAHALGCIGGAAVPLLESVLSKRSGSDQLAVCEGLLRCAEGISGAGAAAIYDKLRALPNLPLQLRVAALRGSIRSSATTGLPLLIESIRSESSVPAADAIRISIEIPGTEATQALVGELAAATEPKQILLLQALGCRGDATAVPALLPLAQSGSMVRRIAALHSIMQLASPSSLPVLAALAKDPEVAISNEALTGLIGFPTKEADPVLLGLLDGAAPKVRIAVIGAISQRRMTTAVPALLTEAGSADAEVANASLKVLRELAGTAEIPGVVSALSKATTIAAAEAALVAICSREPDIALHLEKLLVALATAQGEPKLALLRVLGKIGDPQARTAVQAAAADADGLVKKTALQVLADWPTNDGFTSLFNGKDLAGWNGKPGWWRVEDGALTVESTPEKPCTECNYLIWRGDQPADFELLADFKLSSGANSGIQLRSKELLNWDTFGYQADMTGDGSLIGFVYHHKYALIAGRGEKSNFAADGTKTVEPIGNPAELLKHFKQGDWNTYRITCSGPRITLNVNGVLMCQITDHRVATRESRGIIALQMHPGPPMKIQFKNIRIKQLKPDNAAPRK
jgi:HEAT repeat protein